LVRWVIRLLEDNIIGLIVIAVNGKGQRLGDMAAGTTVIKLKQSESLTNLSFEKVEEVYVSVFPEVAKLTDNDANTIRQVIKLEANENSEALQAKLANKLKQYLGVQTALSDLKFLEGLLKDYNKLNGKL
jgi:hypothetical protein